MIEEMNERSEGRRVGKGGCDTEEIVWGAGA